MPSSYSNNLKIELIATGEQDGTWGNTTNTNLGTALEQAIVGRAVVTFATDADLTLNLTTSNAAQDARAVYLVAQSGVSLTASRNLVVPTIFKNYVVKNDTTGSQDIVVKTSGGTGVTVPNGKTVAVYVDNTNVIQEIDYIESLALGGTPTAPTAAPGTNTTQIATTAFIKDAIDTAVAATKAALYPVGSIYTNATNNTNPATLLGFGTWVAFGAGRAMVGFDSGDPLFDTAEETGGSKDAIVVSHTHTATSTVTDPGHTHSIDLLTQGTAGGGRTVNYADVTPTGTDTTNSATTGVTVATTVSSTGSSATNANLQPYITVYMWKRTA
jgi:hypothetical protein